MSASASSTTSLSIRPEPGIEARRYGWCSGCRTCAPRQTIPAALGARLHRAQANFAEPGHAASASSLKSDSTMPFSITSRRQHFDAARLQILISALRRNRQCLEPRAIAPGRRANALRTAKSSSSRRRSGRIDPPIWFCRGVPVAEHGWYVATIKPDKVVPFASITIAPAPLSQSFFATAEIFPRRDHGVASSIG